MSLKLESDVHFSNQYSVPICAIEDDEHDWNVPLAFATRLVIDVTILAVFMIVVYLIFKLLKDSESDATVFETDRLLPKEEIPFTYGTCEEDVESGKCTCSGSSSEGLYSGKICIICYQEQRNCFFLPCGHFATCYICAQRITEGESKSCPVCRRLIHRVRKLFTV